MRPTTRSPLVLAPLMALVVVLAGGPAWACGFLVAENGAIRLDTFTAASILEEDGDAHYVTAFSFQGSPESFGAIIPLPAVPSEVERAPDWFLQRLGIETTPVEETEEAATGLAAGAVAASAAEVIAVHEVDALDITVLEGGGAAVLDWADANGYDLGVGDGDVGDRSDAIAMLDFYGERSPYFAALRFDTARAAAQDLASGDGTPVRFTFPDRDEAWIPVAVLGFDKPAQEVVVADLYLLTPGTPTILAGRVDGTDVVFQREYDPTDALVVDLRGDERADWIPEAFTLTRIDVRSEQRLLDFDVAARVDGLPDVASAFGAAVAGAVDVAQLKPLGRSGPGATATAAAVGAALAAAAGIAAALARAGARSRGAHRLG
jgi:hypothetical protein